MKTAMQQLIDSYDENKDRMDNVLFCYFLRGKMQQLLEIERVQIIDAFDDSRDIDAPLSGKAYLKKTFEKP